MSNDELRRILKVFGVSVTDFADEAGRIRERAGRLSEAPPEEIAGLLRDLCELLSDVEEKFAEAGRAVEAIKRDLFSTIAEAARARAGG